MIKRIINLPKSNSYFVFGARGTGKSTLISTLFDLKNSKQILYLDLLDPQIEKELALYPERLLEIVSAYKILPEWIIIDEVQKIPKLLDVAHKLIFEKTMDTFGFENSRCVNAFLDFTDLKKLSRKVYQCFEPAHHNSPIYKKTVNKGFINFTGTGDHELQLKLTDFSGNYTSVKFNLKSQALRIGSDAKASKGIIPGREEVLKFDGGSLFFAENSLFDTTMIVTKKIGNVIDIGNYLIPINEAVVLNLELSPIQAKWDTAKIVLKLQSGSTTKYLTGTVKDGFFKTKINLFGKMQLLQDTVAPGVIFQKPKNLAAGTLPPATGKARFKVNDSMSDINHYTAFLNGEWTLLQFDGKSSIMWVEFDPLLAKGKHELIVEVTDKVGNKTVLKQGFVK
jgi:hypothetical protein